MRKIVILGGGPRGLAVALQASLLNYDVTIIDNRFLSTWSFPNMISNIQMRSPISFDLTTLNSNLKTFSLSNYLGYNLNFENLEEVESSNIFCNRAEFVNYLKYIISFLKASKVKFILDNVTLITSNSIVTKSKKTLEFDYLIIATGKNTQTCKCPSFLKENHLNINSIYNTDWNKKEVYVVGDGQQSAEYINYLNSQNALITWVIKKEPKVSQYPVPSFKDWGHQTAFGNSYLNQTQHKLNYLENVKNWGPSITPYIYNKIKDIKLEKIVAPSNTKNINTEADFILATGYEQDINILNFSFDYKKDPLNSKLPNIKKDFKLFSQPNIYFTGLLALYYDGPRQGSILSSANTAKTIMESIQNNA